MTNDGNRIADENGKWGENIAAKIIETHFGKFRFINELIDYQTETGIYIEIKTCQYEIQSSHNRYPVRPGRFNMNKEQHTYLLSNDGYYVFLVKSGDLLMQSMVIPAKLIDYRRLIMWKRLFDGFRSILRDNDTGHIDTPKNPDDSQTPINDDLVIITRNEIGDNQ